MSKKTRNEIEFINEDNDQMLAQTIDLHVTSVGDEIRIVRKIWVYDEETGTDVACEQITEELKT